MQRCFSFLSLTIGFCTLAQTVYATDTSVPFIHADQAHDDRIRGSGVTVAVIDTGVDYSHPGLDYDLIGGWSWVDGLVLDNGANVHGDTHGTIVSLVITDPSGVAPHANIMTIRVTDANLYWTIRDLTNAIRRVTAIRAFNIRVINISLSSYDLYSCPCDDASDEMQELADAIGDATAAGIITVAATGNQGGCGQISSPACISGVVPVIAAYDDNYGIVQYDGCTDPAALPHLPTCFSNMPDGCGYLLAAPGYDINVGGFTGKSGTSYAAPHVSGVAALMFQYDHCSGLNPATAWNLMYYSGHTGPASPFCPLDVHRTVDAYAALNAMTVGPCPLHGDFNCDGTIDAEDFRLFLWCLNGLVGLPVLGPCACAQFYIGTRDEEDPVDLRDFAEFQVAFTGYGEGACCHFDGSCTVTPVNLCTVDSGDIYQGHGTTCAEVECPPPPWGACCAVYTGECSIMEEDDCVWSDGVYQGDGTDCETTTCPIVRYDNTIDPLTTYIGSPTGILADDVTLDGSGGGYLRQYTVGLFAGYAGPFDATVSLHTGYPPESGNRIQGTEFTYYNLPDNGSPVFVSPIVEPSVYIPNSVWIKVNLHGSTAAGWFRAEEAELGFTENYYARYDPPWSYYWWGNPPSPWAGFWATITCDSTRGEQSDGDHPERTIVRPDEIHIAPLGKRLPVPIEMTRQSTISNRQSNGPTDERRPLPYGRGSDRGGAGPRSGTVTLELTSPAAGQAVQAGALIEWSITATVSDSDNSGLALVCVDLSQDAGNPELFEIPIATTVGVGMEGFQRPDGIDNPEPGGPGSAYGGTPVGTPGQLNLAQIGGAQNTFGVEGEEVGIDIIVDQGIGHVTQVIAEGAFYAPTTEGTYLFTLENGLANVLDPGPPSSTHWPVTAASVTLGEPLTFTVGDITCTPGDLNDDGVVDGRDIQPFVSVFLDPGGASPWESCAVDVDENEVLNHDDVVAFIIALVGIPEVTCILGDVDDDGTIDGNDVQLFVTAVLDPGGASPQQFCAADFDGNDVLGAADADLFAIALLGTPDVQCELGDVNDDSVLDGRDILPFIGVLLDPPGASPQQFCAADCDDNDQVNIQDVPVFVGSLLGG